MKITKKMFKGFEGLEELKKMQKEGYCNSFSCSKCPLKNSNIKIDMVECSDIIDLSSYRAKDFRSVKTMNKIIDIFTKENINSILTKLAPNRNLKYNDYVVHDNKVFKIKGVEIAEGVYNPILLSGYDADFRAKYESCIVDRKAMEKEYTLWVDPSEIFALNDTVLKESNIEYKIVAIDESYYPILLNNHNDSFLTIREEKDILCSIPEAYEENYSKWVASYNIQHK
jgi:hypothetical protein